MPDKKPKSEIAMSREGNVGRIEIEGVIGWGYWDEPNSYDGFKKSLNNLGDVNILELYLQSPGGVITDGTAMANLLREHPATVHTYNQGEAGSMASVLLLAGDKIFIPDNAMTFIHKPLNEVRGNADEMRKQADELDKFEKAIGALYKKNFKGTEEELTALMASETWYTADEMAEKFENVTVVSSGGQKAAATSEPFSVWDFEGRTEDEEPSAEDISVMRKILAKFGKNKKAVKPPKEVDMPMTQEEMQELAQLTSQLTATSMVSALETGGFIAKKEEPPKVPATQEEPEPVAFEGDPNDAEAVQAHLDALKQSQMLNSVDWNDPASVIKYQEAVFGKKENQAPVNSGAPTGVRGTLGGQKVSDEQVTAKLDEIRKRRGGK